MKYVSWMNMPGGAAPINPPDSPPIENTPTTPTAYSMGVWNCLFPRHIVPIQLNTLIAEGTAISSVDTMNVEPSVGFIPLTNMWWPHTIQPRKLIPQSANTIEW